jgi:hypothetical protein
MSILKNASSGIIEQKKIDVIYGPNKVGKTTLASQYPSPFFADIEKGSLHLNVTRDTEINDLTKYRSIVTALLTESHPYKTFVTDSVEALEGLICDAVCTEGKVKSIELFGGGFGKGFMRTREIMREVMSDLRKLAEVKGMNVVLLGHSQQKTFTDPVANVQYDRYTMRVNDKMGSIIKDLADNIFFITYRVYTSTEQGKTQAFSTDDRVLKTTWTAAYDAGNRSDLPPEVVLRKGSAYQDLQQAIQKAKVTGKSADQLREEIHQLMPKIMDQKSREKASQKLAESKTIDELNKVLQKVTELTTQAA